MVYQLAKKDWLGKYNTRQVVLQIIFKSRDKVLASTSHYFEKPKELDLPNAPINYQLTQKGDRYQLQLQSRQLARFVKISVGDENIVFSDNYFDLLPNQPCTVVFQSALPLEKVKQGIKIISLVNTVDAKN
jgi:beta-mannosidase